MPEKEIIILHYADDDVLFAESKIELQGLTLIFNIISKRWWYTKNIYVYNIEAIKYELKTIQRELKFRFLQINTKSYGIIEEDIRRQAKQSSGKILRKTYVWRIREEIISGI